MTTELSPTRWEIVVKEMQGDKPYYRQHQQKVGDQSFVHTVRDIATKYRIHKDNYEYIKAEDRETD